LLTLKQDPDVARLAATYLKYLSVGLPAYAFNGISRWALHWYSIMMDFGTHARAGDISNPKVSQGARSSPGSLANACY
jgi:hypothetical protein